MEFIKRDGCFVFFIWDYNSRYLEEFKRDGCCDIILISSTLKIQKVGSKLLECNLNLVV